MKTNGRWVMGMVGRLAMAAALAFAWGCASPQTLHDRGLAAESRGDYAAAVANYAKLSRKAPTWPGIDERLSAVGNAYWTAASGRIEAARASGDAAATAERYLEAERVLANFTGTRVRSPEPAGFASSVTVACQAGTRQLLTAAEGATAAGSWREAEGHLTRAESMARAAGLTADVDAQWATVWLEQADAALARGNVSEADRCLRGAAQKAAAGSSAEHRLIALQRQMANLQLDETIAQIRAQLAADHYRAAYDRAIAVETALGDSHSRAGELQSLQRRARDAGQRRVAYLPYWLTPGVADATPAGWLAELSHQAEAYHWQQPADPFVAAISGKQVDDVMRPLEYQRRNLSAEHLTIVGQRLTADYVVYGELSACTIGQAPASSATIVVRTIDVAAAKVAVSFPVSASVNGTGAPDDRRRVENELIRQLNAHVSDKVAAITRNYVQ